jgi:hypothetical protein
VEKNIVDYGLEICDQVYGKAINREVEDIRNIVNNMSEKITIQEIIKLEMCMASIRRSYSEVQGLKAFKKFIDSLNRNTLTAS